MNAPGADGKYTTVKAPLTDGQLLDHLAGRSTYAAYLIGADGLVSAACIELDEDAIEGGRRVLEAAQRRGVVMFSIAVKGAGQHDGSHNWALFAGRHKPADAAHLARQIATDAGYPDCEVWPRGQAIRLPFGVHTHTQQRGRLTLASGETFLLDQAEQLADGLSAVAALPLNAAPPPAPVVERAPRTVEPMGSARPGESVIDTFNRVYTAAQALEMCGATQTKGGAWSCNEPSHSHSGKNNLLITDQGLILSYSNKCYAPQNNPGAKALTPFGYYCEALHGGNAKAAVKAAAQLLGMGRASAQQRPRQEAPHYTAEQASAYNATRRDQRHTENRQALDLIADAIGALDLSERAIALGFYLIGHAHDTGLLQIRPTNEEIGAALGYGERTIQYAFRELEAAALGKRQGGRGGLDRPNERAVWTFYRNAPAIPRVQPPAPPPSLGCKNDAIETPRPNAECTLSIYKLDLYTESDLACEGGAAQPARDFDPFADYVPAEIEHGADELAEPVHAPAPAAPPAGRIGRSGPRWFAERQGCYTWHLTAHEARQAAGLVEPPAVAPQAAPATDQPGASYDPARDITDQRQPLPGAAHEVPAWLRSDIGPTPLVEPAPDTAPLALDRPRGPRDPARIADPALKERYYKLVGKAKKTFSSAQARMLRDEAARLLNGADLLPAGSAGTGSASPRSPALPAARRAPGDGQQAGLWGGI